MHRRMAMAAAAAAVPPVVVMALVGAVLRLVAVLRLAAAMPEVVMAVTMPPGAMPLTVTVTVTMAVVTAGRMGMPREMQMGMPRGWRRAMIWTIPMTLAAMMVVMALGEYLALMLMANFLRREKEWGVRIRRIH